MPGDPVDAVDLPGGVAAPLRQLTSHAELLAASGEHPFVRYDLPAGFAGPAFTVGSAVAFIRQTQTGRRLLAVLEACDRDGCGEEGVGGNRKAGGNRNSGGDGRGDGAGDGHGDGAGDGCGADLDRLLAAAAAQDLPRRLGLAVISVPQARVALLHKHFQVGDGGDWDWMWTTARPWPMPGESRIMALDEADLPEIRSLLQVANPTTHARPGERDEQWIGVRDALGPLVACAALERNAAGWPHLSGISVHPGYRGTGLGLALTANLTRQGVDGDGVCTLGMFSDNNAARRVYQGLGYRTAQAWASRPLTAERPRSGPLDA